MTSGKVEKFHPSEFTLKGLLEESRTLLYFAILKGTLPLSMSRIANQIVQVCAWLVNFQPVLIPPPSTDTDEVDMFFAEFSSETDYDADTELSDGEF